MLRGNRWVAGCLGGCIVGVLVWFAFAESGGGTVGSALSAGSGLPAGLVRNDSLNLRSASLDSPVASDAQSLGVVSDEGGPLRRMSSYSPAAVAARVASRMKFAHLGAARAVRVAREAFPEAIERPAGGPPPLPPGERVTRYVSADVAQLALPDGKHAVAESSAPMAIETSRGHRTPVDLSLTKTGSDFASVRPVVGVLIPQRLSDGVRMPEGNVSLTPVNAQGSPLGGSEGALDGASVLYANTQTDTDTVVKPTSDGFNADAVLRSIDSPGRLYYRVGLAQGASLVQARRGEGPVKVVDAGRTTALVLPPSATDAAGTPVQVSMSASGDLLTLTVASHDEEHQYPIWLDPTVIDSRLAEHEHELTNWKINDYQTGKFGHENRGGENITQYSTGKLASGEWMASQYETQGESHLYEFSGWLWESVFHGRSLLQFAHEGTVESGKTPVAEKTSVGTRTVTLCAKEGEAPPCSSSSGTNHNLVWYKQIEIEAEPEYNYMESELTNAWVYISQEKAPTLELNKSEADLKEDSGRENVAYEPNRWLGPSSGAFEMIAKDPGIGVSRAGAQDLSGGSYHLSVPIYEEGKCSGVQCNETYRTAISYSPGMGEGAQKFELWAEDETGLFGYIGFYGEEAMIKVDAKKPENIVVSGWSKTREISAAPHTLTFEATDSGKESTHSSGMRSISVSVDGGQESTVPNTSCPEGPCTASGKWTLDAEGLSEGVHRLLVNATDNAGNVAEQELRFDVRHGSPVPVGPGTVDPTTGQLKLSATDVSLAGAGAVSRVYESRNLTAGTGGPLGPQWAIGLGGGEGLTVLPEGSVVLTGSTGGTTTFTRNEKGEFESPLGDGNVKIEAKEKETGKGITEYLLEDPTAGMTTTFEQPSGIGLTMPVYSSQFGVQGGAQLNHPADVAIDSSGNEWVADYYNGRVVKFSPSGVLLASYGTPGQWLGEFKEPRAIAINQSTGNVYVSDEANSRIVELNSSGSSIRAFGWGVSDGKNEFETCTSYCRAGIAGSGNGQLKEPKGVAVDSSGNVWVVDAGNDRIQEFTSSGEYKQKFGSAGAGEGQFKNPRGLAFAGGNLYVAEVDNDRVQELSTVGKYVGQIGTGKEGTGNSEFKYPTGVAVDPISGNIYVSDGGNNRVQEFTSAGKFVTKFGSGGSGAGQFSEPKGLAVSSSGGIYVADYNNNRMQEWTRPSWLPTRSEGSIKSATTTYAYKAVEEEEKTVIQPTEAIAPAPTGVTCTKPEEKTVGEALVKGCRALLFAYATTTSASGEAPSEWGDYNGHLKKVSLEAYNPAVGSEKMEEKAVAEYSYDKKGRLRAEWDPRISPSLKTTYGYDEEGHVTSVDSAGEEPWLLHYGGLAGEPNTGRLLSVTRPAASSKETLKEQAKMAVPVNTEKPTLSSTSPEIGTLVTATSEGKWSNSPLAYSYQWEDCHLVTEPEETVCVPIQGAVNQSYTPQAGDAGFKLVVQVTAENIDGVTAVTSGETKAVPMPTPSYSKTYGKAGSENGQFKEPAGIAVDSEGNLWVADLANNRVQKLSSSGGFIGAYSPDSMLEPEGIAVNPINDDVYVTNRGRHRVDVLSSTGVLVNAFGGEGTGPGQLKSPDQLAIDSRGDVWVDDTANNRIEEFSTSGVYIGSFGSEGSGHGQFKNPTGIAICNNTIYVTDQGNERIQEFSLEGKWLSQFGREGKEHGEFSYPSQIACEPVGNDIYVSDKSNNRIEEFNAAGTFMDTFSGSGETQLSTPIGVAVASGGVVYVSDYGNGRIEKWTSNYSTSNPVPSPPSTGTTSVSTIEYQVPLSGTGLPNLTQGEVEKWGQKDDPVEGMAIFPPDEPMGWPAKEYKRASINYMDEQGRTVNVTSPSGAISTAEYNEINQPVRTLSADNRAAAMKETGKTAEVSKKLDTQSVYNENNQLAETLGPEHEVKLSNGSEVQAREHVKYSYDEGAPEGDEHDGLITKTTDAALVSGKEEDVRTTLTSYSGQKGLGWTLRKPTSVTTDPTGLDLTKTTEYDETTGNVIQTKAPGGTSVTVPPPVFSQSFGTEGSGNGQFKRPVGVATDASGHVWVNDRENDRIEKFSAAGGWEGSYGTKGSGADQLEGAWDLAVNQSTGNVYVGDSWNDRIDEFGPNGEFLETFGWGVSDGKEKLEVCKTGCKAGLGGAGEGELNYPLGVAVDSHGDVWVVDLKNNRVVEFSEAGAYVTAFGTKGSGNGQLNEPNGIAIDEGEVYVTDQGNHRVEEFSPTGTYLNQFGSEGTAPGQFREPTGIAVNPNNSDIYVADESYNRVEEFSPAGKYLVEFGSYGTGPGHFEHPTALAINASGDLYVGEDTGDRVDEWLPPGAGGAHMAYSTQFGSAGSGSEQFNEPVMSAIDGEGDVWVTDFNHARVKKFTAQGKFLASYGSYGHGEGQFEAPTGIAVNQGTGNVYVADCEANRIEELSSSGGYVRAFGGYGSEQGKLNCPTGVKIDSSGDVWVADTHNNRVEEYTSAGGFLQIVGWGVSDGKTELEICKSSCKTGIAGSGNGQFSDPSDIAISGSDIYVADSANRRVQELTTAGGYVTQFGNQGDGGGQFVYPEAIATDSAGHLYVVDFGNDRVEEFSASGQFLTSFASHGSGEGQLSAPRGIAINAAGDAYVADTENNRIEVWAPSNQAVHDTQTVYYSAAANPTYPTCGEHPEWADLVCQTQPGGQPEDGINLPVSDFTYNVWDEIETTTETFGSIKRAKTQTYDPAGRALTSETSSTIDTALPKVTNEYNTETGALENQSTTEKGETKTVTSKLNTLGQLTSYTDADKNTTTYEYEPSGDDRLEGINDGKGSQTYAYDPTTGFLDKLVDSAAGTFTAGYDVEGKMLTETYPDGLTATNTLNPLGQTTGLAYEKSTHCATKCPETWFSDTIVPSIHGETLSQTSTLAKDNYVYDSAGRLTQTQEEPSGEACATRIYAYDEESNRTSLTSRKGSEGKCATEGGTVERHIYDTANRPTDTGVTYEAFGNTTTLPASDTGGKYEITSTYYVDNQIAGQTENEKTLNYHYDPTGRTRETETVVKGKTESTMISHYSGPGEALSWTSEGSEKWSRNIPGIDGALDAIQTSAGSTTLQLHDLQGNIVATAGTSETETKPLTTYNSTEFGVPNEGKTAPKYAWLGATGVSTELSSGVATKGGASYVPQIARDLQTAPVVPPGAFPNGQGSGSPYTSEISGWSVALSETQSREVIAEEIAKQEAEACERDPMSCVVVGDPAPKLDSLTINEAAAYAYAIRQLLREDKEVSIGSLFLDLKGAVVEAVEGLFTGDAEKKWDEDVASELEACVSFFEAWGFTEGGCLVSTPQEELLGGKICVPFTHICHPVGGIVIPDLSKPPTVFECGVWVSEPGRGKFLTECIR